MNVGRVLLCLVVILALGSAAEAGVATVTQTLDYTDNGAWDVGPFFYIPGEIEDHPPFFRHMDEDWGWFHDMSTLVPADATGIQSARVGVYAWDVSLDEYGEVDRLYANDVLLGVLEDTGLREYKWTYFDLPQDVLDELWTDGEVYVFLNIDVYRTGGRVMLAQARLIVNYLVSGTAPEPDPIVDIYRFLKTTETCHFYTAEPNERDKLVYKYRDAWTYENVAYRALDDDSDPDASPIYRFWSKSLGGHFYTIDPDEYNKLVTTFSHVWTDEGVAFYAFEEGFQPTGAVPVYRFWSPSLRHHFYTSNETERDKLINSYSDVWTAEGIAWYAYPPDEE